MGVTMRRLDHVNVRTANLDAMVEWYGRMLGMTPGWRPAFDFPGAWLYAGEDPVIHLVGVKEQPEAEQEGLRLEHFALSATGLGELVGRAKEAGERYMLRPLPNAPVVQVNLWDPDGNHIHIDFDKAEAEGLDID